MKLSSLAVFLIPLSIQIAMASESTNPAGTLSANDAKDNGHRASDPWSIKRHPHKPVQIDGGGGSDGKGNGGVAIVSHGTIIPMAHYYKQAFIPVRRGVCDLIGGNYPTVADTDEWHSSSQLWQEALNHVVSSMYETLPAAGEMLRRAYSDMVIYLVHLNPGDYLTPTTDDGNIIGSAAKFNCAVRLKRDRRVFIDDQCLKKYWEHRDPKNPFVDILSTITHEAGLAYYDSSRMYGKFDLDMAVGEILTFAGFYAPASSHPDFSFRDEQGNVKPSETIARILNELGLFPSELPLVSGDFKVSIPVVQKSSLTTTLYDGKEVAINPIAKTLEEEWNQYISLISDRKYRDIGVRFTQDGETTSVLEKIEFYGKTDPAFELSQQIAALGSARTKYYIHPEKQNSSTLKSIGYGVYRLNPQFQRLMERISHTPKLCNL